MRTPRVLWASPFNLHDTSSGAAVQTRILLGRLAARGMTVQALGGMIFDSPAGMSLFKGHEEQLAREDKKWFRVVENEVEYFYGKTASPLIGRMTAAEERTFFSGYGAKLKTFRPDAVLMYGGGCLEYAMRAEAALHGIPTVYFVCNGEHKEFNFPYSDLVLTDSQANVAYYARENHILVEPVGTFIEKEKVVVPKGQMRPEFVTFVNPVVEKGVAMVARLALMAQKALPEAKFLVVQSRGRWLPSLQALRDAADPEFRLDPAAFSNVGCVENQTDMREVYARTKVVLMPSLWYEGWGRVATEAVMNGIPVIASTSGGLAEAMGGGGRVVPCPERCHKDFTLLPTEEEVQPWLEALTDMLDPSRAARWRKAALQAAEAHSIEKSTDRLVDALTPLLARRPGSNPRFYMCGTSVGGWESTVD